MLSDAFHVAVKSRDGEALAACLAEDVRFRSPVVFRPYEGRAVVTAILAEGAMRVFEDFEYTDRFESGDSAALVFRARVGEREVEGLDLLRFDGRGLVREMTVMVRPMSGLAALSEAMAKRFDEIGLTAPAGAADV